jgi:hypothetical protein
MAASSMRKGDDEGRVVAPSATKEWAERWQCHTLGREGGGKRGHSGEGTVQDRDERGSRRRPGPSCHSNRHLFGIECLGRLPEKRNNKLLRASLADTSYGPNPENNREFVVPGKKKTM